MVVRILWPYTNNLPLLTLPFPNLYDKWHFVMELSGQIHAVQSGLTVFEHALAHKAPFLLKRMPFL